MKLKYVFLSMTILIVGVFLGHTYGKECKNFYKKIEFLKTKEETPDTFILIYQMGKVASISIDNAIGDQLDAKKAKMIRLHRIASIGGVHKLLEKAEGLPERKTESYRASLLKADVASKVLSDKSKKILIITGVRDPLSAAIASYFQNIDVIFPGYRGFDDETAFRFLKEIFLARMNLKTGGLPSENDFSSKQYFFDKEIKKTTDIDVYQYPFNLEKGYQIIERGNIRMLIYKFERLHDVFPEIERFVKPYLKGPISMKKRNIAAEKPCANVYAFFKQHMRFNRQDLDAIYGTKYAQHFYSKTEIKKLYERWLNKTH